MTAAALRGLRKLAREPAAPPPSERCALCSARLPDNHAHLIDPKSRELGCACGACAVLFGGGAQTRWKLVPRRAEPLPGPGVSDAQWDALRLPIELAFFLRSSGAGGRVVAFYPGPAGAAESLVPSQEELLAAAPLLAALAPDIEALLVDGRRKGARRAFVVSIDECYRLVGLIRAHWRGLSGGAELHEELGRFFAALGGGGDA